MKKTLSIFVILLGLSVHAMSPNEMLVMIGAVKYYNENCAGLNSTGFSRMNRGLKYFKMHKTPIAVLEKNPLAVMAYQTAKKFGCGGTKREAHKTGFSQYIN